MIVCILAHITSRINSRLFIQIINLKPESSASTISPSLVSLLMAVALITAFSSKVLSIFHNISLNPGFFHRYHFCIQICQDFTVFLSFYLHFLLQKLSSSFISALFLFLCRTSWRLWSQELVKICFQHSVIDFTVLIRLDVQMSFSALS